MQDRVERKPKLFLAERNAVLIAQSIEQPDPRRARPQDLVTIVKGLMPKAAQDIGRPAASGLAQIVSARPIGQDAGTEEGRST